MFTIILTFIGLVLFAALLYGGINYVNYEIYDQKFEESNVTSGFYNYETAIDSYKKNFNVYPDTANWITELGKIGTLLPNNQKHDFKYEYNTTNNTVAVCYDSVAETEGDYKVIEDIFKQGQFIISENCFSKTNETIDQSSYPVKVSLTKWIKK